MSQGEPGNRPSSRNRSRSRSSDLRSEALAAYQGVSNGERDRPVLDLEGVPVAGTGLVPVDRLRGAQRLSREAGDFVARNWGEQFSERQRIEFINNFATALEFPIAEIQRATGRSGPEEPEPGPIGEAALDAREFAEQISWDFGVTGEPERARVARAFHDGLRVRDCTIYGPPPRRRF
jgi:hypothetical protein